MSEPQKGNHDDVYEIEPHVDEMISQLKDCGLEVDGLFNDADAGFDTKSFRMAFGKHGMITNVFVVGFLKITSLIRNFTRNDGRLNAPTLGWTVSLGFDNVRYICFRLESLELSRFRSGIHYKNFTNQKS